MVVGQRGMEEKRKEARERKRKETRKRFWLNQKMLHTCEHEAHSNRKWRIFAKRRGATKVYVRAILNVGHLARRRRREHHCHSYRYEKRLGTWINPDLRSLSACVLARVCPQLLGYV